jgi:hypothetical protein
VAAKFKGSVVQSSEVSIRLLIETLLKLYGPPIFFCHFVKGS